MIAYFIKCSQVILLFFIFWSRFEQNQIHTAVFLSYYFEIMTIFYKLVDSTGPKLPTAQISEIAIVKAC